MELSRNQIITKDFYPRPPRGGRQQSNPGYKFNNDISIHALREEGDLKWSCRETNLTNFYPRPPRGGRQQKQRKNTLLLS